MPTRDPHELGYVQATELPDGAVPEPGQDGNFILGPLHKAAPELADPDRKLEGTVVEFTMDSAASKFYPGIKRVEGTTREPDPKNPARLLGVETVAAPYQRKVAVYVPKGYVAGSEAPFIVGADGPDQLLFATLDGLIAEGKLPPIVAVSIGNGGGDSQGSERGLEYDTVSGRYGEFVEAEVLPAVEAQAGVVPPGADLLGDLHQPAMALESEVSAGRMGVSRAADSAQQAQAAAGVDGGGRQRLLQHQCAARRDA